jgi:hypothetical protein
MPAPMSPPRRPLPLAFAARQPGRRRERAKPPALTVGVREPTSLPASNAARKILEKPWNTPRRNVQPASDRGEKKWFPLPNLGQPIRARRVHHGRPSLIFLEALFLCIGLEQKYGSRPVLAPVLPAGPHSTFLLAPCSAQKDRSRKGRTAAASAASAASAAAGCLPLRPSPSQASLVDPIVSCQHRRGRPSSAGASASEKASSPSTLAGSTGPTAGVAPSC